MKKLVFTAAVAAAMGAFAIESANTVGYTTKEVPAGGWMLAAVQFDKVGSTALPFSEAFDINADAKTILAWDENEEEVAGWTADAPCIKVPLGTTTSGYQNLYYTANAWDDDHSDYVPGWADADGFLVTDAQISMLNGYGVWFVAGASNLTVTIKGEVKSGASDTITGDVGWNMLKLPYPVSINALSSKINWNVTGKGVAAWDENEDEIEGWTADAITIKIPLGTTKDGYQNIYYSSNAWDDDKGDYVEGWADADGFLVTDAVIPEGQAFWFVLPSAPVTSTVTK